jgi:hypothetical protein
LIGFFAKHSHIIGKFCQIIREPRSAESTRMFIDWNDLVTLRPLSRRLCVWAFVISLIFSSFGRAQTSATGAITGVVLDPSGAVVPSVSVQVSSESGGFTQATSANENGWFAIQLIPLGTYQLQASRSDFKTLVVSGNMGTDGTFPIDLFDKRRSTPVVTLLSGGAQSIWWTGEASSNCHNA